MPGDIAVKNNLPVSVHLKIFELFNRDHHHPNKIKAVT